MSKFFYTLLCSLVSIGFFSNCTNSSNTTNTETSIASENEDNSAISEDDFLRIEEIVSALPEELKSKFIKAFESWKEDWRTNPKTALSSNTDDAKTLKTYAPLKAMGSQILPLIIKELTKTDNFFALVLYDDLQKDQKNKSMSIQNGEHQRVIRTIKLFLKNERDTIQYKPSNT